MNFKKRHYMHVTTKCQSPTARQREKSLKLNTEKRGEEF